MNRGKTARSIVILLAVAIGLVGLVVYFQQMTRRNNGAAPPGVNADNSTEDRSTADELATAIRFADATANSGVNVQHHPYRSGERYIPEIMGSGVLLADFNRDGACDLLLIDSGSMAQSPERPADSPTTLWLNNGKGVFRNATDEWQVPQRGYGMGGAVGDYDNDGWPDVYLTSWGGGDLLLRNDGQKFVDVTAASQIQSDGSWSTSAGFFDMDLDGDLDLFVVRYIDYTMQNAVKAYFNKVHVYPTPLLYDGLIDRLWRNNGDGTFADVTETSFFSDGVPFQNTVLPAAAAANAGEDQPVVDVNACKGLAVSIGDIDADGDPDIYVANDTTRNLLFVNRGDGVFDEMGRAAGVAYGETGTEQSGMGVDFSDINGDSLLDIVCTNFQGEPNNIYIQNAGLFFVDRTDQVGVGISSRARLKFGAEFFDADNDGDEDLLVVNGHIYDNVESFAQGVSFGQQNSLYELGAAGKFVDISAAAGSALQDNQVSRGLAVSDLNHDGRLDFVVTNNGGTAQVAFNETEPGGHWVSLWLEGKASNRSAIGAKVTAKFGDREIRREILGTLSYLSISDFRVHLGVGDATVIDELTIQWPGGETRSFTQVATDRFFRLAEGGELVEYVPGEKVIPPEVGE